MIKIYIIFITLFFIANCSLNKVINHHGVHFLEKKEKKLIINKTNMNDLFEILGPPSTKGTFDKDMFIYIERKTSSSRITKLGKKDLLINDVLIVELNSRGILESKILLNKKDINSLEFLDSKTTFDYTKKSFVYKFLGTIKQKINDPLGKRRLKKN